MNIPKVIFKPMTLEENIEIINWAFYKKDSELDIHQYTIELFPELANIDLNLQKEEVYNKIKNIVSKTYLENIEKINNETQRYNIIWNKYNDKYFDALSSYLEVIFPKNIKEIIAYVGIIPIFPRCLDNFSFSISINLENWKVLEVVSHETLHFLWFLKLLESILIRLILNGNILKW